MSNLKEDFQTHLLNDLQPIAQQQQSFEPQNHIMKNSFIVQGNSFILDNNNMLSQQPENNQNLNIFDHTLFTQQNNTFHYANQQEGYTYNMFKKHSLTKQSDDANAMANEQYKNSSKLQDQLLSSENDKLNLNQQGSEWTENDAEVSSFTIMEQQNSNNPTVSGRGRRKVLVQNMVMGHRDHMLLGSKVISGLQKNIVSLPFRQPVDIQRFNIPDYHQIVKQPMDLRTIKRKISSSCYETIEQIYTDIQLIITNSMKYNEFNADFIRLTKNFQKSYYKIRRDCERNLRRLKMMADKKKNDVFTVKDQKEPSLNLRQQKPMTQPKHVHHVTAQFPTNQVQVASNFTFSELIKLAKRIKRLQPHQQIQLFKKIEILNTMVVDIKLLSTKDIRILLKQVQRIQKLKQEMIRQQEKKQYSHLTMCSSEYGSKCAV